MALMFGNGALYNGSRIDGLIHETGLLNESYLPTHVDPTDITGSIVQGAGDIDITTEITFAQDPRLTIVPTDVDLLTVIEMKQHDNRLTILSAPHLQVSITLGLQEPTIKDVTSDLEVIDHIETDEKTLLSTEAV